MNLLAIGARAACQRVDEHSDKLSALQLEANDLPEAERVVKAWIKGKLGKKESSSVVWKAVEKHDLLSDKHVVLLAERWGNGEADFGESDSAPLGEIVEKVSDTIDPSSMPSGTPCVGLEHVGQATGTLDGTVLSDPSALKSGKVRFAESDILYGNLRPNLNKVLTKFLLHTLQSQPVREYLMRNAGGAAGNMPKINQGIVESIPIPLPPLEEQRRIVAEIEGYQQVITGARQILAGYRAQIPDQQEWPTVELRELIQEKPKNGYSGKPVQHATKLKVLTLTATTSGNSIPRATKRATKPFCKQG